MASSPQGLATPLQPARTDVASSTQVCSAVKMNADTFIEEVQKLPPEEIMKVGRFLDGYLTDLEADKISSKRAAELFSGMVNPISHEEVFGHPMSTERSCSFIRFLRKIWVTR